MGGFSLGYRMSDSETADSAHSGRLEPLAAADASGSTIRAAAESIGISERSGYRISGTEEFRIRVAALRSEIASVAVGKLTSAASQAVDTLRELLGSTNEPKVRIDASKLILNSLGPLTEHCELRSRLDALESGR